MTYQTSCHKINQTPTPGIMTQTTIESMQAELENIENSLDSGSYRSGRWRLFLDHVNECDAQELASMEQDISRVSNKLHRKNHFFELPVKPAMVFELSITSSGLICFLSENPFVNLAGVVLLVMGLQPTIKFLTGSLLGIKYAYAYFLNVEPRFKMLYGTYVSLSTEKKVLYHLSGAIGTPLAMLIGFFVFSGEYVLLANACMVFFLLAALMQIGAFTAVWMGYRKIGGYVLENLTSPAMAAAELKRSQKIPVEQQS